MNESKPTYEELEAELKLLKQECLDHKLIERAYLDSEEIGNALLNASDEPIILIKPDGMVISINSSAASVFEKTKRDFIGKNYFEVIPDSSNSSLKKQIEIIVETPQTITYEETINSKIFKISMYPIIDNTKTVKYVAIFKQDLTNIIGAMKSLQESEEKIRAMSEASHDALVMINSEGKITFWNPAAEKMFGFSSSEAIGTEVHSLIAADENDIKNAHKGLKHFAKNGEGKAIGNILEFNAKKKDGFIFPIERSVASFQHGKEWYAIASMRDITERKIAEEKLYNMAIRDPLTNIYNRRYFLKLSKKELERCRRYRHPISFLMIDADNFKQVNDNFGHETGDVVLKIIADIASSTLRESDIFGRIGGEEFGLLLPEANIETALDVAERFRQTIEKNVLATGDGIVKTTVSVGISCLDEEHQSLEDVMKHADIALYAAKGKGKNRVEIFTN